MSNKTVGRMVSQALHSVVRKPITSQYPFVKDVTPDSFRGRLVFRPEKCIGCKICMRDCPSDAITITKIGEKQFQCEIDLSKCIYCGQCVDSCPKDALETSPEFELAQLDRASLIFITKGEPRPVVPAAPAAETKNDAPAAKPEDKA